MPVKGSYLMLAAGGSILLWSGLKGKSWSAVLRNVVSGQNPANAPVANPITGATASSFAGEIAAATGNTGAGNKTAAANQAIAKVLAAPYGWSTGQEWADLVSLWNKESDWSNTAENPSDAYGIAQALGHGPTNQYPGGIYASANPPPTGSSNSAAQIAWGLSYIKSTYGDPIAAWAHEVANNWY